jgi:hypothetical protein
MHSITKQLVTRTSPLRFLTLASMHKDDDQNKRESGSAYSFQLGF